MLRAHCLSYRGEGEVAYRLNKLPNYVDEKIGDLTWNDLTVGLQHERPAMEEDLFGVLRADFDILVIIAKADKIMECPIYRHYMSQTFRMPHIWWEWFLKGLNGYFGVEETEDQAGNVDGYSASCGGPSFRGYQHNTNHMADTWACFETKFYYGNNNSYVWHKREIANSHGLAPHARTNKGSFLDYEGILRQILDLQDRSVWMIRDQVRAIEKNRALVTEPNPDYSHLHELARHAIHVSETLDTAATTVDSILGRHAEYVAGVDKGQTRASKQLQDRLHFLEHMFISLKHRSASNQARLQNEIQLSFNIVAQSDARTSVEIGRAAQKDSAAMKTVAFLTLTFLPATFISAIFSTSFFNLDGGDATWTVSNKIWIYWAVAIPVTLVTILLWYFWHRLVPPALVGDRRGRSFETGSPGII